MGDTPDEPVTPDDDLRKYRVPRGLGGWQFAIRDIVAIGMLGGMLVMILTIRDSCGSNVAKFMTTFEADASAKPVIRYPFDASPNMPEEWKLRTSDASPAPDSTATPSPPAPRPR